MMKRDFQPTKIVGGEAFIQKSLEGKNKNLKKVEQTYMRDVDSKRLKKWEIEGTLTDRNIITNAHLESRSFYQKTQGKKLYNEVNQFVKETQQENKKPCIKIIEQKPSKSQYENNFYDPRQLRPEIKYSDEVHKHNQKETLIPQMRDCDFQKKPKLRDSYLTNQTDFINQKKHILPSMRTLTYNHIQTPNAKNQSQFSLKWDC